MSLAISKLDVIEKVKLRVGDLRLGMFVCELDRPWLDTPFLLQGFELKTEADINAVRQHCGHVYIDLFRSRTEHIALVDTAPPPRSYINDPSAFTREIRAAETSRTRTSALVKSFVDDVKFGRSPDVQLAKSAAADCVDKILRHPDTMMFVTRMQDKDEEISQHAFNVCTYAVMLGHRLGLKANVLEELGTCGLLHDIGEVDIPLTILAKHGPLKCDERHTVDQHPRIGRDILMSGRTVFSGAVDVAYAHHEHMDGSGYPRGLQGHQLSLHTKIIAVVEKYDALTSDRRFRPAYNHLDAIGLLNGMAEKNHIDQQLTATFTACLGVYPPGSVVELSSGEIAIVLQSNPKQRLRPCLLVVRDPKGQPTEQLVDLALKDRHLDQPYKIRAVHRAKDFGIEIGRYREAILGCLG